MSTAHVYMAKNAQNEQCTFKALSCPCQQQRSQLQLQILHWFTYYQGKHELINEYSPTKVTSVPPGQKLLQMVMHRDAAELQLLDSMHFCRYPPALPTSAGTPLLCLSLQVPSCSAHLADFISALPAFSPCIPGVLSPLGTAVWNLQSSAIPAQIWCKLRYQLLGCVSCSRSNKPTFDG